MSKDIGKIRKILKNFPNKKILIIGDIMLDHYVYGDVTRISPEAPIPILKRTGDEYVPGGAANVASNLSSLGAKVFVAGVVGNDHAFEILKKLFLKANINFESVYISGNKPTIQKERLVAKYQHIVRLDTEETSNMSSSEEIKFLKLISKQIKNCDGVILSDYSKGCLSYKLTQDIIKLAKIQKIPVLADVKPRNKTFFKGVDLITPNLKEALEMTGMEDVYSAGKSLANYYKTDVVITKSEDGISVFKKNGDYLDIPAKSVTIIDVVGAGDTFIAVECLGYISGLSVEEAGLIATVAGSVVVQKPGTATITLEELESALDGNNDIESISLVPKVWGYEKWLENNDKYCCKLLSLNKGYQCSLHYHKEKDEMFFVTKGHVRLESDGKIAHMKAGNFQRIRPGTKHRFRGIEDSIIIEVSTYHDEGDSHRIEIARKAE